MSITLSTAIATFVATKVIPAVAPTVTGLAKVALNKFINAALAIVVNNLPELGDLIISVVTDGVDSLSDVGSQLVDILIDYMRNIFTLDNMDTNLNVEVTAMAAAAALQMAMSLNVNFANKYAKQAAEAAARRAAAAAKRGNNQDPEPPNDDEDNNSNNLDEYGYVEGRPPKPEGGVKHGKTVIKENKSDTFRDFIKKKYGSYKQGEWKYMMEKWLLPDGTEVKRHFWYNKTRSIAYYHLRPGGVIY